MNYCPPTWEKKLNYYPPTWKKKIELLSSNLENPKKKKRKEKEKNYCPLVLKDVYP